MRRIGTTLMVGRDDFTIKAFYGSAWSVDGVPLIRYWCLRISSGFSDPASMIIISQRPTCQDGRVPP
jgi:hypothetical protein